MSLVGHWPLHEDSGRANDLSGNNNNGTVYGATQGVSGIGGLTSYSFDGTDDYVDVSGSEGGSFPVSISAWVLPIGTGRIYSQSATSNSKNMLNIELNGSGQARLYLRGQTSDPIYVEGGGDLRDGDWHLITGVAKGNVLEIYADGKLIGRKEHSQPFPIVDNANIGRLLYSAGDTSYFNGHIADTRLYDRALTPKEVRELYEWGAMGSAKPDGTSRYTFNEDDRGLSTDSDGVVYDSWGSNDGDVYGAVFENGKFGDAASFDGADDYIDVGNVQDKQHYTLSTWIKPNVLDQNRTIISAWDSTDSSAHWRIILRGNSNKEGVLLHRDGADNLVQLVGGNLSANSWNHLCAWWNGSTLKLYVNGKHVASTNCSGMETAPDSWNIGRQGHAQAEYFDGLIDDVRIYPRALTPHEISAIYNGWVDLASPPTDGVSYYPLDGDAVDQWGSNDGTVNGAAVSNNAIRGRSHSFDGTDDYIDCGGNSDLSSSGDVAVSAWVYPHNLPTAWRHIAGIGGVNNENYNLRINRDTGNPAFFVRDSSGTWHIVDAGPVSTHQWYHIVGVFDSSEQEIRIYLNGALANTTNIGDNTLNTNSQPFTVGAMENSGSMDYFYDGNIDDVRIYDRALSPHEVHRLYLWGTRGRDLRPQLVKR